MIARLAVLASGNGSNLQALLDATAAGHLDATVVAVISDNPAAKALDRARSAEVPTVVSLPIPAVGHDRREWDADLASLVARAQPDWIVLAGVSAVAELSVPRSLSWAGHQPSSFTTR
jgi:phosphoribosylglycinamide formyltransferase 1